MDGQDPLDAKPMNNHPNAVKVASAESEIVPETEPELPGPKNFEPVEPDYYKHKRKKGKWIAVALVVLVIAAAATFVLLKPKQASAPTKTSVSKTASQSPKQSTPTATTSYTSNNLNLSFNYPKGWQVSDKSGANMLSVTSPATQLKSANGQAETGQIVMTIRTQTQSLPEFSKGNATAVIDSQKINYTNPTQTQRAATYISFLNYASSSATGLDAVYITSDNGYQNGQAVPLADISKEDPVVNISFNKCINSSCSGTVTPMTLATSAWNNSTFSKPLINMLESLSFQ